jgi:drug/metabolite transporter (DMT)-like permease
MKNFYYRLKCKYKHKFKKIVGIVLAIIGCMIIINIVSIEFLLILIGIVLIIMALLLLNLK